jgi:hypothetical protein
LLRDQSFESQNTASLLAFLFLSGLICGITKLVTVPGWACPFCGADCSPIAGETCVHYFLTDGEFGWRFSPAAQPLFDSAQRRHPTLFRDLLYHDAICRLHLVLRRAVYEQSLEVYVFTDNPEATIAAFASAVR